MDTAVSTNTGSVLNAVWTFLYGTTPTFSTATADLRIDPGEWAGFGGAAIAAFLSIYGAYNAGASAIKAIEVSYFAFLEEFQDNDKYITELENDETGPLLHDFLTYYAWDLFILSSFMFWHVFFLIGTGAVAALTIYTKIIGYSAAGDSQPVLLNKGWRLLLFGVLFGSVNLLAGNSVTVNQENILKLVGFTPAADTDDSYSKTTEETDAGVTTITTFVS